VRLLWFTLADPDPPTNGQFIYSKGLIHAAVTTGASVHVVGLDRPEAAHRDGQRSARLTWSLGEHRPRSPWQGLLTRTPFMASRVRTPGMRERVTAALDQTGWDGIVFDSLNPGWAWPLVRRRWPNPRMRPIVVYIAHNHEARNARKTAADEPGLLRRSLKRIDARRVAWLEQSLVTAADLVTANAPDDCDSFQGGRPGGAVIFLPPGYDGPRTGARTISAETPRRVLIVGSFDWPAKRQSLEAFLAIADPLFAAAGIELLVVGSAEAGYLDRLRKTVQATRFTGRVDDVGPFFAQGRLALVPDLLGGFKLKTLDYVFNRLPILAIAGAAPGLPLRHGDGIVLAPDHVALARAVMDAIDDFDLLNRLHDNACRACQGRFEWPVLGARLLAAIEATTVRSAVARHAVASH
jgi:glycosyltransferase involved in cell wall biosynthesis